MQLVAHLRVGRIVNQIIQVPGILLDIVQFVLIGHMQGQLVAVGHDGTHGLIAAEPVVIALIAVKLHKGAALRV